MPGEALLAELNDIELEVLEPVHTRILFPLDLVLHKGTSLAVVGPSGAGKSSLATILGALQPPSAGTYVFEGEGVEQFGPTESAGFRSRNVGFVFQNANLIDERSAWRNVAVAITDPALERSQVEALCREALSRVGLEHVADREAALLSGGERQRVAIARAVVKSPKLVIADEPTGALDQATGQHVLDLLYGLTQTGATLVIVTHDVNAASMARQTVEIVDGRVVD